MWLKIIMGKILEPKVEISGTVDMLITGVAKQILEKLAKPIVGDATPVSAVAKGIVGGVIHGKGGKLGQYASNALLIDAGEDGAVSVMNFLGLSASGETAGNGASGKTWWS